MNQVGVMGCAAVWPSVLVPLSLSLSRMDAAVVGGGTSYGVLRGYRNVPRGFMRPPKSAVPVLGPTDRRPCPASDPSPRPAGSTMAVSGRMSVVAGWCSWCRGAVVLWWCCRRGRLAGELAGMGRPSLDAGQAGSMDRDVGRCSGSTTSSERPSHGVLRSSDE